MSNKFKVCLSLDAERMAEVVLEFSDEITSIERERSAPAKAESISGRPFRRRRSPLSPDQQEKILKARGSTQFIAAKFNVHPTTVGRIKNGTYRQKGTSSDS